MTPTERLELVFERALDAGDFESAIKAVHGIWEMQEETEDERKCGFVN